MKKLNLLFGVTAIVLAVAATMAFSTEANAKLPPAGEVVEGTFTIEPMPQCMESYGMVSFTRNVMVTGKPWRTLDGQHSAPGDTVTMIFPNGKVVTTTVTEEEKNFAMAMIISTIAEAAIDGKASALIYEHGDYRLMAEDCGSSFHIGPQD